MAMRLSEKDLRVDRMFSGVLTVVLSSDREQFGH